MKIESWAGSSQNPSNRISGLKYEYFIFFPFLEGFSSPYWPTVMNCLPLKHKHMTICTVQMYYSYYRNLWFWESINSLIEIYTLTVPILPICSHSSLVRPFEASQGWSIGNILCRTRPDKCVRTVFRCRQCANPVTEDTTISR